VKDVAGVIIINTYTRWILAQRRDVRSVQLTSSQSHLAMYTQTGAHKSALILLWKIANEAVAAVPAVPGGNDDGGRTIRRSTGR